MLRRLEYEAINCLFSKIYTDCELQVLKDNGIHYIVTQYAAVLMQVCDTEHFNHFDGITGGFNFAYC